MVIRCGLRMRGVAVAMNEEHERKRRRRKADSLNNNGDLPICPSDGKPCGNPERGCFQEAFGVVALDGKSEILWVCPRFKAKLE